MQAVDLLKDDRILAHYRNNILVRRLIGGSIEDLVDALVVENNRLVNQYIELKSIQPINYIINGGTMTFNPPYKCKESELLPKDAEYFTKEGTTILYWKKTKAFGMNLLLYWDSVTEEWILKNGKLPWDQLQELKDNA
jgi:hypothetical protein